MFQMFLTLHPSFTIGFLKNLGFFCLSVCACVDKKCIINFIKYILEVYRRGYGTVLLRIIIKVYIKCIETLLRAEKKITPHNDHSYKMCSLNTP